MAKEIDVTITIAWWFKWYMYCVILLAKAFQYFGIDVKPDAEKVCYWAEKSMVMRVNGKRVRL